MTHLAQKGDSASASASSTCRFRRHVTLRERGGQRPLTWGQLNRTRKTGRLPRPFGDAHPREHGWRHPRSIRRMMRAPVKPAPPIGLGIPLPEVMLMCSPTMTIPVRQRDTRSAAWPRVTFVVRREPTVELSPSRDQLYCSLSGLSRHNPCSAHTLEAAANRSSGCTVLGNDINRRPAV